MATPLAITTRGHIAALTVTGSGAPSAFLAQLADVLEPASWTTLSLALVCVGSVRARNGRSR